MDGAPDARIVILHRVMTLSSDGCIGHARVGSGSNGHRQKPTWKICPHVPCVLCIPVISETWSGPQKLCRLSQCSIDWSVWELDGSREGLIHRHGVDGIGVIMKAGTENMFKWSYTGLHMTGVMLAVELLMCMVQNFFTCFYDV